MPDPTEVISFADFLRQVEDGGLAADLTDELQKLVADLRQLEQAQGGKPEGKINLVISFKLDGGVFEVRADVAAKVPRPTRMRSLFYATPDNRLTANNPRQLDFGLKVKDVSTTAVRDVHSG